ncbi:MAG: LacI family DNA-binding transcriptional regulator [Spirochaetes bacterium]|nr:LacI family DNA-binding transcriptional regulator [Spirochaetota bacterium]
MATLRDIAKLAGVDVSTVSRALNNSQRVRTELKEKIQKIAKKMNYVPNASAYSLKKRINRLIALVLPSIKFSGGEFYQEILRGINEFVEEYQFAILLSNYSGRNSAFVRVVRENRVDGGIIIGDIFNNNELKELDALNLPLIVVNQRVDFKLKNIIDVYSDNIMGAGILAEHLIKVHERKKILFIGGGEDYQTSQDRVKGFTKTITGKNIQYEITNGQFEQGPSSGYSIVKDMIKQKKFIFDAILAASDTLAIGAMRACFEERIRVPEDVSIVGYDNIQATNYFRVPITSVDPSALHMGQKAGEFLLKWVTEKTEPRERNLKVTPHLIIRKSCGCS